MEIGLHLPEVERVVRWNEIRDLCRVAEDVGFDSLWVPDHLVYRDNEGASTGPWECWSMLSAVAAVTSRVAIGPLVLCTSFREPGLIAKMAATLDEISDGRLILGLGAGWNETEYEAFGFPYETRFGQFREAFHIISTLLRDGQIDFEGCYYTLRDCEIRPRGPRSEGPPLLIGSKGSQVLRMTLPHVSYWNGWARWWGNDVARVGPLLEEVDQAAREAGQDPTGIQKTVAMFVRLNGGLEPDDPGAPYLEGSNDRIVEELKGYSDRGIQHVQIVLDPITTDGIERFGAILEQFRG